MTGSITTSSRTTRTTSMTWPPRWQVDAASHRRGDGRRREGHPAGGRVVGHGLDQLPAARARARAPQQRRQERQFGHQHRAGLRASRQTEVRLWHDHRAGERAGRTRAWPEGDQLPGGRDLGNPEHRAHIAKIWGMDVNEMPQPGWMPTSSSRKSTAVRSRDSSQLCFNPVVSLPDNNFVRQALEKLEFYVAIDFFLNETARYAHVVLPGSQQEEDEGTVTQIEGRVIKINKAVDCRAMRNGTGKSSRTSRRLWAREAASPSRARERSSGRAARCLEGRCRRLLRHHLREDREELRRVLAVPGTRSPRHAPPVRARDPGIPVPKGPDRSTSRTARHASR
jgi:anaerobic selenocysteine-containing dehydrogenase